MNAFSPRSAVRTRTTTRTKTSVVTDRRVGSPPATEEPTRWSPSPPSSQLDDDDSDNPDHDATISFATDSSDEESPSSPTLTSTSSICVTTTAQSQVDSVSQSTPAPGDANANLDEQTRAFYESRYPGQVPHPDDLQSIANTHPLYYVVTAGTFVGIFIDWNIASRFVIGVSRSRHHRYKELARAWKVYRNEWEARAIRVLTLYQDAAPLSTQVTDSGLERN
ncbi:hypothetical protein PM082_006102 [Marasmius tenuissimus]|nr:hypothetical protein PM082_006102 [Marasmius tenuissimus]